MRKHQMASCIILALLFTETLSWGSSDAAQITELCTIKKSGGIRALCFTGLTNVLAVGSGKEDVYLHNVVSGAEIVRLPGHKGGVRTIRFNAEENSLLVQDGNGVSHSWDMASMQPHRNQRVVPNDDAQWSVSFKGRTVRVSCEDGPNSREVSTEVGNVSSVTISPNGRYVAAVSSSAGTPPLAWKDVNRFVSVWDLENSRLLARLPATSSKPISVAMNSSGSLLAAGGNGGDVKIWKIEPPLEAFSTIFRKPAQKKMNCVKLTVNAEPMGARIYSGARFIGKAPLEIRYQLGPSNYTTGKLQSAVLTAAFDGYLAEKQELTLEVNPTWESESGATYEYETLFLLKSDANYKPTPVAVEQALPSPSSSTHQEVTIEKKKDDLDTVEQILNLGVLFKTLRAL